MWTWFEGWARSYPDGHWSRVVSGGSPTFTDAHRPAEWIASSYERDQRWELLDVHDYRAEWHWTSGAGWKRERGDLDLRKAVLLLLGSHLR